MTATSKAPFAQERGLTNFEEPSLSAGFTTSTATCFRLNDSKRYIEASRNLASRPSLESRRGTTRFIMLKQAL